MNIITITAYHKDGWQIQVRIDNKKHLEETLRWLELHDYGPKPGYEMKQEDVVIFPQNGNSSNDQ